MSKRSHRGEVINCRGIKGEAMISDVLSDAIAEIDEYLANPHYKDWYDGDLLKRIIEVRNAMESVLRELDTPPS